MKKLLIVNADDLGYDPEVTRGILEAARQGVVRSATLMVNGPHSQAAAQAAQGLRVGLHLNLSRWAPVWPQFPAELLTAGKLDEARAPELVPEVVAQETLAQLDLATGLLGRPPTHLDVHRHLHAEPAILEGLVFAAARRALPVRAISSSMRARLRAQGLRCTDHFIGDAVKEAYWTPQRLWEAVHALKPGVTELMCHPGYRPTTVNSGYAEQREVELRALCEPRLRAVLEKLQVVLADFRALAG
jgi:chitin disaccharide deacetylase